MRRMDFPFVVVVLSFLFLFVAAQIGDQLRQTMLRLKEKEEEERDFGVLPGATLTLLGLLIGFSFSMAVSRYDQRKNMKRPRRRQSPPSTQGLTCPQTTPPGCVGC